MPDMRIVNKLGSSKGDDEAMVELEGVVSLLESHFIEGTGITENGKESIQASDMEIIGVELINNALTFLIKSAKPESLTA